NSATCQALVEVIDNAPPIPVCNDVTVYLDASGTASITAADLDGGSTDHDSLLLFHVSQSAFTCADIGTLADTLFVSDGQGNSSFCIAQVTVLDTLAPVAQCQPVLLYLDDQGEAVLTFTNDHGNSDACDAVSYSVSDSLFT